MTHVYSPASGDSQALSLRLAFSVYYILLILLLSRFIAPPALADGPPFTRQRALVAGTTAVATGDLNGDGALDIIATFGDQDIIYLNDGAGSFNGSLVDCTAPPADVRCFGPGDRVNLALVVGDINGDGALDLISSDYDPTSSASTQSVVYLNDGAGNFYTDPIDCAGPAASIRCFGPAQSNITSLAVGDLNGDGALDIVAGANEGSSVVYLNDGAGNFYAGPTDCTTLLQNTRCFGQDNDFTQSVAVGDLDRDGDLDITAGTAAGSFVYLNDGAGNFYAGPVDCAALPAGVRCFGPLNYSVVSLALGDVNDDGALDIVAGTFNAFEHSVECGFLKRWGGQFLHRLAGLSQPCPHYPLFWS